MGHAISGLKSLPDMISNAFDADRGEVKRGIFVDDEIYSLEKERIFNRSWLFLGHETQVPEPGNYITAKMGETSVIIVRAADRKIAGFINSCRHRGNPVTRADAGTISALTCPYHGWCYNLSKKNVKPGGLIGIPGRSTYYGKNEIDIDQWGLVPIAQVDSYKGLVFGTFDPTAPSLHDFLGDLRWALDIVLDQGDLAAVPGVARWQLKCNWKFAADNAIGDNSHAQIAHRSAFEAMSESSSNSAKGGKPGVQPPGFTMVTGYGHGMTAPMATSMEERVGGRLGPSDWWLNNPAALEQMGPFKARALRWNFNVFPNLFIIRRMLMIRNPIGPGKTEIRGIALYDRNAPEEVQQQEIRSAFLRFGPSGFLEQEDGENWDQATVGARMAPMRDHALNYAMGLGKGVMVQEEDRPPLISSVVNEHAQRWFYGFWSDIMASETWEDLDARRKNATTVL